MLKESGKRLSAIGRRYRLHPLIELFAGWHGTSSLHLGYDRQPRQLGHARVGFGHYDFLNGAHASYTPLKPTWITSEP